MIENLTVTALYHSLFTVTFLDADGTVLDTQTVEETTAATEPDMTGRTHNGYPFSGWDADFSSVMGNLTVTAEYAEPPADVAAVIDGGQLPADALVWGGGASGTWNDTTANWYNLNKVTRPWSAGAVAVFPCAAAVTVSAPVGLTDFVSEGNESGFGSGANKSAGSSGGRMNNDIRKKNRNQKPAAADKPTEKPAEESLSTTVVPASEVPSRSRRSRGRGRGPVQRTDSDAMASRYDMAESDEDYEKLNALVAEAESVFEAKKAEASARALFAGGGNTENMPSTALAGEDFTDGAIDLLSVLVKTGLTPTRSEARRAVEQGGVTVGGEKVTDVKAVIKKDQIGDGLVIRRGKKNYHTVVL